MKCWLFHKKFVSLQRTIVDPRFACPNFSGILEALCSFLQAENLRTFQIA